MKLLKRKKVDNKMIRLDVNKKDKDKMNNTNQNISSQRRVRETAISKKTDTSISDLV